MSSNQEERRQSSSLDSQPTLMTMADGKDHEGSQIINSALDHHLDQLTNPAKKKLVDLDSYFRDLPSETPTSQPHPAGLSSKSCSRRASSTKPSPVYIVRSTRRACRLKTCFRSSRMRNPSSITVPPSRDENDLDEEEGDDSDEGSEDEEWVREKWNQLIDRQRAAEADVRRAILSRDRLDPLELSRWLDSEETCTLPLPNLGVRLRMIEQPVEQKTRLMS